MPFICEEQIFTNCSMKIDSTAPIIDGHGQFCQVCSPSGVIYWGGPNNEGWNHSSDCGWNWAAGNCPCDMSYLHDGDPSTGQSSSDCYCISALDTCPGDGLGPHSGDVNQDGSLNVNDITMMVGHLIHTDQLTDLQITLADMNQSGHLDVMDIIGAAEIIFGRGGISQQQFNQIKQQVTRQTRGGQDRRKMTRGGRVNSGRFSGRTQNNPKGKPRK